MKRFKLPLIISLISIFEFGFSFTTNEIFPTYSLSIIGGPIVRIPGINAPTVIQLNGVRFDIVRWVSPTSGGVVDVTGDKNEIASVMAAGTYQAQDVEFTSIPGEPVNENVHDAVHIDIPLVAHSIQWQTDNSVACLVSNASAYMTNIVWKRNGRIINGSLSCSNAFIPGTYSASVTYSYGNETATLEVPGMIVTRSDSAPDVVALTNPSFSHGVTSYNPVTPPFLKVVDLNKPSGVRYDEYWLLKNDTRIVDRPADSDGGFTYQVSEPGVYVVGGWYTISNTTARTIAYAEEIDLQKGDIPTPIIVATNNGLLKYNNPTLQLTAQADLYDTQATYGNGYTWYLDGQVITGAVGKTINITKPGNYSVRGCATYPDGTTQCKTSDLTQITGEIVHVNLVRKKTPLVEKITSLTQLDDMPFNQVSTSSSYLDGFARPIQQVQQAMSPLGNDLVVVNQYDSVEREPKKFLPFARTTGNGNYLVMPASVAPLTTFYQLNNDNIANTAVPFAETIFENSPLNRVLSQGAPGEDWQINNGHAKSLTYNNNSVTDKIWILTGSTDGLSSSAYYPDGTLSITTVTDEDGHVIREFKNKTGQVVASEKVIEGNTALRTYFVFDDMGRLTHVVPPNTVSSLADSPSVSFANDVLARECFTYQYDNRSRQIVKNIPGAGPQFIVYDKWDRVVLTQHANQRTHNKWSFNKYDALDRVIMTGEISVLADQPGATQTVSDFYAGVTTNPFLRFESSGENIHGYTNRSYPTLATANQAFTVSYYDNYDFLTSFGSSFQFTTDASLGLTSNFPRVQSLITGAKALILGTTNYLRSAHYYDKNHRLIQIISDNHLGGIDKKSNTYDFTGKILKNKVEHHGLQSVTFVKENVYDHAHRLLKIYHTMNNGPRVLLASHQYNELGQLIEQNVHSEDGNTFLQSLDYSYNIRGWLSQVNPEEINEQNVRFDDLYRFGLSYTSNPDGLAGFKPSFTGNITAFTEVRPINDDNGTPFKSAFTYQYDTRSQLTQATYLQLSNPAKNNTYDLQGVTYDPNGNIKTLQRKGITSNGTPGLIDNLIYSYNGNQLINVGESADVTKGFIKKN